jgi:hypothetical protein
LRSVLRAVAFAFLLALVARAPAASAAPGLFVGATDDGFLWHGDAGVAAAQELGLAAVRVTVPWAPEQSELSSADVARFDAVAPAAGSGLRIVVTVFGKAAAAPQSDADRGAYCDDVRDLLVRYPMVNDVVIWNEPNLGFYWQPQFTPAGASAAPAAYERLLARCWDVLHAYRPSVNILMTTSPSGNDDPNAVTNVSHSPGAFIRKMGAAYRASGRTRPIFDTVGHNPYGMSSAEPPSLQHLTPQHLGEGDLDRLVQALDGGFGGTAQPVPGRCAEAGQSCVSIWYLEAGYQTVADPAHQSLYTGRENDAHAIPVADANGSQSGPTQSTQLADGIELAYCQPYVTGFFNFLLWDEVDLARWQSGVFWPDGTRKASFDALQQVVRDVKSGGVDCARVSSSGTPSVSSRDSLVERIEWPETAVYSSFNEVWSFAIETRADVSYRATLRRVGSCVPSSASRCQIVMVGTLRHGRPSTLTFPQLRLAPGTYRLEVRVSLRRGLGLTTIRRSPAFRVAQLA